MDGRVDRRRDEADRRSHRHRDKMDRRDRLAHLVEMIRSEKQYGWHLPSENHGKELDRRGHRFPPHTEPSLRLHWHESEASPLTERQRETMNSAVWSMLPSHLLDLILVRLPFHSLCRLSRVCKKWNRRVRSRRLRSRRFMQVWEETPCRAPWLLFFNRQPCHRDVISTYSTVLEKSQLGTTTDPHIVNAYDSESNKWHNLRLWPCINREAFFTTGTTLASDGGLVCHFTDGIQADRILVSNPLTKYYRRLPVLLEEPHSMTMLTMVCDRVSNTYKVVAAGRFRSDGGRYQNKAEVYDSRTETWTITGNIPVDGMEDETVYFGKPVFCHGLLYVWNSARQNLVLLTCDLDRGVWNELRAPLPVPATFEELFEWQGRILMVGTRLGTPEDCMGVHSTCIWELHASSLTWIEVDRMPAELFHVCFRDPASSGAKMTVVPFKAGKFVYIFSFNPLSRSGSCKWVVYNLSNRTWQNPRNISQALVFGRQGPQSDAFFSDHRTEIEGIFYEPRLDVRP